MAALVMCLAAGCGSGEDPNSGMVTVSLSENVALSSPTVLAVDVSIKNVSVNPVYGVVFDLDFDSSVIAWSGSVSSSCSGAPSGCAIGSFLETTTVNGVLYDVALQKGALNKLVIGATQTGNDPGVLGNGPVVTLFFNFVGAPGAMGPLNFSNRSLRDPVLANIPEVVWKNATVTVP